MNHRYLWLLTGFVLLCLSGYWHPLPGESLPPAELRDPSLGQSNLRFIRNDGQWDARIRYQVKLNGGRIDFEARQLLYTFVDLPERDHHGPSEPPHEAAPIRGHVLRTSWLDSHPETKVSAALPDQTFHNYFIGRDPSRWAGEVPLFAQLTYEAIYEGIDVRFYGLGDAMKYDYLLAPGADPAQIQLRVEGADSLFLEKGALHLHTSVRNLKEMPPFAYQEKAGRKVEVPCEFVLEGEVVSYRFPQGYDRSLPLVIDPTLIFSTYSGSAADNWGFTATYDLQGNAYAGGIEWNGFGGYPTTPGAFLEVNPNGGLSHVTISKFDPTGANLVYATYLGGNQEDQPHSLVVDDNGELIVFGRTRSADFAITPNAFQPTLAGDYDMFVTRFNANGTALIGSTYLGGTGEDGINGSANLGLPSATKFNYGDDARGEVIVGDNGNIYVVGPTRSTDFPMQAGGIQPALGGGQDGIIANFNGNLTALNWSTYYGGNGDDAVYAIRLDDQANVYVAGGTASTNLFASASALNPTYQGGTTDGFVAKINPSATAILAATYLGSPAYDQTYLLDLDDDFDVYVSGQTLGTIPTVDPPTGPVYSHPGAKQFIQKLSNNLDQVIYATNFGSPNAPAPNISPTAFLVDNCENVYVTGWGGVTNFQGNTQGMETTFDAEQATTDGSDLYLIVFSRDAQSLLYATYLGGFGTGTTAFQTGEHVDGGTCRFDKNGVVYHAVCAECGQSAPFPTTAAAYSPNTGYPDNCNLAVFKMAFDLTGVSADFEPLDQNQQPINLTQGCAPLEVFFENESFGGSGIETYFWDFDDGGASSTLFEPTHTFNTPGTYEVMLVITDSSTCNITDTAFKLVEVFPPPNVDAGPDLTVCQAGDTVQLLGSGPAGFYEWTPNAGFIVNNDSLQPQVRVQVDREFILTITDAVNGCTASDTMEVRIDNTLAANARPDTTVCQGGSLSLQVNAPGASMFNWTSSGSNVAISDPDLANPVASNLDTTTWFYVNVASAEGCVAQDSFLAEVFEVFTLEDTFVCADNSLQLTATNGATYSWAPNDGSLSATDIANPVARPDRSTTYSVTAVSAAGCISVKEVEVTVFPRPVAVAGPDTLLCAGETVRLQASGGSFYFWSPTDDLSSNTSPTPLVTPAASRVYQVRVTDGQGCADTAEVSVALAPNPPVNAGPDVSLCAGDSLQLQASGALAYLWIAGQNVSDPGISNPVVVPDQSSEYVVSGTDANGCEAFDTVQVAVINRPIARIEGEGNICLGELLELTATGGERYEWSTGDTTAVIFASPDQNAIFFVTAFNGQCAGSSDSIVIDVDTNLPVAAFAFDDSSEYAPQRIQFDNQSTGAVDYEWRFPFNPISYEENPAADFPSKGEWEVMLIVTSPAGCRDTLVQLIALDNVTLHVPSAFTPNNDDHNQEFLVGYQGIRTLRVEIYSRWGMLIYESDDPDFRWDGTYQGKAVPEGVYVYVIRGIGENDLSYQRTGTVTLIR